MAFPAFPYTSLSLKFGNELLLEFIEARVTKLGKKIIIVDELIKPIVIKSRALPNAMFAKLSEEETKELTESGIPLLEYHIYLSEDKDKLKRIAEDPINYRPRNGQVFIFIENDQSRPDEKLLRLKIGNTKFFDPAALGIAIQQYYKISAEEFELLLNSAQNPLTLGQQILALIKGTIEWTQEQIIKQISKGLDTLIELAEKHLKIEEDVWNPSKQDQVSLNMLIDIVQSKVGDILPFLNSAQLFILGNNKKSLNFPSFQQPLLDYVKSVLQDLSDTIGKFKMGNHPVQLTVSLLSGIWNGVVDMVLGIVWIIKLAFDAIHGLGKMFVSPEVARTILNYVISLLNILNKVQWTKVFAVVLSEFSELLANAKDFFIALFKKGVEWINELNLQVIAYYWGYILTFFIPMQWLAQALGIFGRAGVIAGKILVAVDELMQKVFGFVIEKGMKAADVFFTVARAVYEKLDGLNVTERVINLWREVKAWIMKWVDEVMGKKTDDVAEQRLPLLEPDAATQTIIDDLKRLLKNVSPQSLTNNTMKGNFGEAMTDLYFLDKVWTFGDRSGRFKKISAHTVSNLNVQGPPGIDAVYEFSTPPPKYVIVESKYGQGQISTEMTSTGGSQMQEPWIMGNLRYSGVRQEVYEEIVLTGEYESVLSHVSETGEITLYGLDKMAQKLGIWY